MNEFRFTVDPAEDIDVYQQRWDDAITNLHQQGYEIVGRGPDGDEPVRYIPDEHDLAGPYIEVYEVAPFHFVTDGLSAVAS